MPKCGIIVVLFFVVLCVPVAFPGSRSDINARVRLTVISELPFANVPMDPKIDFGKLIKDGGLSGVLDPNSIEVFDVADGKPVPYVRTEDFAYGEKGRIQWVIRNPKHREYEIRFKTAKTRPALVPQKYTPMIGVGDLLRYNAGEKRPVAVIYPSRLIDLTGDGKRDLVGCWNYGHDPAFPWDGAFCYPRVGNTDKFEFGDISRLRYREKDSKELKFLSHVYMNVDFADFNKDGLADFVYYPHWANNMLTFFLNSGKRDAGGMPIFIKSAEYKVKKKLPSYTWMRVVDLDNDGAVDVLVGNYNWMVYLHNLNPLGWPVKFEEESQITVGKMACFFDVNSDGLLDSVCLVPDKSGSHDYFVAWRKNTGGEIPRFAPPVRLKGINPRQPLQLAAVNEGLRKGIFVMHDIGQIGSFYEHISPNADKARFKKSGMAESISAIMSLSDQASPCVCDWDNDGDWDLLVGGGYGYPRILINQGSSEKPAFDKAQFILSEGKPIKILRNEVLGGKHSHNMGYLFPVYVDWDMDGLKDMVIPNETNRIFWFKNIGSKTKPIFGPRQQILVEGFPDSPELRLNSNKIAADYKNTKNAPYPYEKNRPFCWRIRASMVDMNGDGLVDLITRGGQTGKLTFFARYRDNKGQLKLRKAYCLKTSEGSEINISTFKQFVSGKIWLYQAMVADWDDDGLQDIICSLAGHPGKDSLFFLRNCGTKSKPVFETPSPIRCFGKPIIVTNHGPHPWVGDMNGDNKPDILCYTEWSVYPFFNHAAIEMKEHPKYVLGKLEKAKKY